MSGTDITQEARGVVRIGDREVPIGRFLLVLIAALVLLFLVVGSLTQKPADPTAIIAPPTNSFLLLALLSFAGGLFSFLSPCTLPILPAYFAFTFRSGRATIVANTLAFLLGLATMFSLFGAGASAIGRLLYNQQTLLLLLGGGLILFFGVMSLLGQGFGGSQLTSQVQQNSTLWGSFIFGLTFAIGWTACIGPILGVVISMAGTTASVLQGIMLLFIYAMGLGLPLVIVSTFFGRASRDSFLWRMMRGKGYERTFSARAIAMLWAFGGWLFLMPLLRFAFPAFDLDAVPLLGFTLHLGSVPLGFMLGVYELGLLALLLLIVWGWYRTQGNPPVPVHLHSTQLVSGVLFLLMGLLLVNQQLAIFNNLATTDLAMRLIDIEEQLYLWIAR
jgi:cytochrome c-type biogenesis protein